MRLVIGGYAQGKLEYVLQKYNLMMEQVWDGDISEELEDGKVVFYHFHKWVKSELKKGTCPEEMIFDFVERHPAIFIICDEIGNGIVPMDPFEREYRERTGRILIELAKRAESVERVICGIGQRIK